MYFLNLGVEGLTYEGLARSTMIYHCKFRAKNPAAIGPEPRCFVNIFMIEQGHNLCHLKNIYRQNCCVGNMVSYYVRFDSTECDIVLLSNYPSSTRHAESNKYAGPETDPIALYFVRILFYDYKIRTAQLLCLP